MAEGFAKALGKGKAEVYSGGTKPEGIIHPLAVEVMRESGIDISEQKSKLIDLKLLNQMDLIITLCSNVEQICPATPVNIRRIHCPINDPTKAIGDYEEVLSAFRKAREEVKEVVESVFKNYIFDD
jgi:arsenate reductase